MLVGETCASSKSERDVFLRWADNCHHPFLFPNQYPVAYSFFGVGCILFINLRKLATIALCPGATLCFTNSSTVVIFIVILSTREARPGEHTSR